jgi:hypothetical protein
MSKPATFASTTETGENPLVFEDFCHFFVEKPPLGGFFMAKTGNPCPKRSECRGNYCY